MNSDFWAITPYYNVAGWKSRPRNYRLFRESLSLPLLTVEWHPDGVYDLGPADADWLVQVKGGDLMWQKERLLDLALDHLPSSVKYVAWLDAEVLFCDPRWHERTRDALERHVLVQPFDRAIFLDERVTSRLCTHEIRSGDVLRVTGLKSRRSLMAMVGEVGDGIADPRPPVELESPERQAQQLFLVVHPRAAGGWLTSARSTCGRVKGRSHKRHGRRGLPRRPQRLREVRNRY